MRNRLSCSGMALYNIYQRCRKHGHNDRKLRMYHTQSETKVWAKDLAPGMSYHLFLSHVWSSGADRMRLLKTQLGIAIPNLQVFLDVDDMEYLHARLKPQDGTLISHHAHYCSRVRRSRLRHAGAAVV